jgi:hypothetical protein
MERKVLIVTTIASMIKYFCMPLIDLLQKMGYEVQVACNFVDGNNISDEEIADFKKELTEKNVVFYQIPFSRKITDPKNYQCYKQLKRIVKQEKFSFIHCHTPIASLIARLVGRSTHTKVMYTAHGFHFFKGAPKKNWVLLYPAEWYASFMTDILITINQEDYMRAKNHMHAKHTMYIPGVGIDLNKFGKAEIDVQKKRVELNIPVDCTLLLSVGELNENKNHQRVIHALTQLPENVHYAIVGIDHLDGYNQKLAEELKVADRVHILGYRRDVSEIYAMSDIFVFPSYREGLSVSLMEAMATGLPCVVSKIRGNSDLIDESRGELFDPFSTESCLHAIQKVLDGDWASYKASNQAFIQNFSLEAVMEKMKEIYSLIEKD